VFGVGALAGALAAVWPVFAGSPDAPVAREPAARSSAGADTAVRASRTAGAWEAWSSQRIAELNAAGKPVFVDFTAAWCVTCQVNKRLVLNTDEVKSAFAERNVALVRADWTRRDDAITQALAALGRNGVPVYVLYRPGKEPLLLPEVLQKQTVLDALATLG
jgi:thiol:disulfide interchange protein DsbD